MAFAIEPRRVVIALLVAAATAILVWFGTGLFPLWPLLWFAPLPVLVFAGRSSGRAAGMTALLAWAAGNLNLWDYFAAALHVPLVIRIVILAGPALAFAFAVLLYRALLLRGAPWSALAAFPAVWVSYEYVFNLISPHGTAMNLAYTQLNFLPFLQLASITGPWGMSFLLLTFSTALAIGLHLRTAQPRQAGRIVAATLGLIAAVLVFGAVRLALPPPPGHLVRVGLVASDLPAYSGVATRGAETERELKDYAAHAESLGVRGAQVIVLPEHLGEADDSEMASIDQIFQPLAGGAKTTIVVGIAHDSTQMKQNEARVYPQRAQVLTYAKHHLLPPFESIFTPGTTLTTLTRPNGTWGVAICKDMDFTPLSRQYGQAGVGLMLVPAWDFTVDRVSHGHMAILRGVESGFAIARAGRGGSLMVSDNRGRIVAETPSNSAPFATLVADVPAMHERTLYLLLGDWFAWLTLALLAWLLVRRGLLTRRQAR